MPAPTPDDLIASDPPPAFPPWMVAADPRLAAQETNRIYRAFRRRRLVHRRSWFARCWLWLTTMPLRVGVALTIALAFVIYGSGTGLGLIGGAWTRYFGWIVIGLNVVQLGLFLFARHGQRRVVMPEHPRLPMGLLAGLHLEARADTAVVVREWLREVGARGHEVAEALYLEIREGDRQGSWVIVLMCGGIGAAPLVVEWTRGLDGLVPMAVVAGAWWGLGAWMAMVLPGRMRPLSQIRMVVRGWQAVRPNHRTWMVAWSNWWNRDVSTSINNFFSLLAFVIVIAIALGATTGIAVVGATWVPAIFFALGGIGAGIFFNEWSRYAVREAEEQLDGLLDGIDTAFDYATGLGLSDDPDEARALLIREGHLGLDDPWPPAPGRS